MRTTPPAAAPAGDTQAAPADMDADRTGRRSGAPHAAGGRR